MVHDSTFRYNFWTFPTYPPPCSRFLINSTYYTFWPPPCHPILCRCTHLSRTLFKVWRQMYPTRISMQRQTCRCTQLPSNIEQCGGEVGTSRQYGMKGGRAECIICRIYHKPWTRWGRCGHIETVWAERGAGRRYNMSNLSNTLNKVGERWAHRKWQANRFMWMVESIGSMTVFIENRPKKPGLSRSH